MHGLIYITCVGDYKWEGLVLMVLRVVGVVLRRRDAG